MVLAPEPLEVHASGQTPWVLVLVDGDGGRGAVRQAWEDAGFAVEIASSARDALDCLKVMTPSLVVIEGRLYRPLPR